MAALIIDAKELLYILGLAMAGLGKSVQIPLSIFLQHCSARPASASKGDLQSADQRSVLWSDRLIRHDLRVCDNASVAIIHKVYLRLGASTIV
ncbi:unnamed protein product [Heligmosomoides polygyrus]|uniref:HA2 domain-containing protein n=1 Tax=Heligmosomoides polygyrus TaxID=6339 RepID=A0A183FBJ5_HELPZ|nr:unnamed protein product [Heligmosomoides polygyrus]